MTARADLAGKNGGLTLTFTRVVNAPRELVFKAWVEPDLFPRWFGPKDFTVDHCTMDVRPGGRLHFCHRHAEYGDGWVMGVYQEIVEPERIVFVEGFSDEAGNRVARPGFPLETLITVTFAERDGQTTVTVRHDGLVVDQGESQGWNETLDRLVELLSQG